jgi:GABA permease
MHNPLRSEAEAFRLVVVVGAGAAAIIALALLTEPVYGAVLAAGLIGLGVGLAWRVSRGSEPHKAEVAPARGDGTHRILVVANQTVGGKALLEEVKDHARDRASEILVVTPALTRSQLQHWVSDVDDAIVDAERRREESVRAIEAAGLRARSEVGDSDPNVAIEDALLRFSADEVIISTHPPDRSRWLERGVVEKARTEVDLPITHVIVDLEAERSAA